MTKGYPPVLLSLMSLIKNAAKHTGLTEQESKRIGFDVSNTLMKNWGGKQICITKKLGKNTLGSGFLLDLQKTSVKQAKQSGLSKSEADAFGKEILLKTMHRWSRESIYIGKGQAFNLARRDAFITQEMGRQKAADLADQFGLTPRQIYTIAKKGRNTTLEIKDAVAREVLTQE